jgi:hypothetical protein
MRLNLRGVVCHCILAMAVLATLATSASAQQGTIQSVTFFTVKQDRDGDFQAAVKELHAAYAKAGSTRYVSFWLALTGPRVYAIARYYQKWADLDAGPDPALKDQAADVARITARIADCIDGSRRIIAEVQPDLSFQTGTEMPKMIRVLTTDVRPDKFKDYLALVKSDILPAAQKGGLNLYQFSETRYGGPNTQVTSVVGMDNWADLDGGFGVEKALGKDGYQALLAKTRPLIIQSEVNEYRFQADLSYLPPATTK